MNCWDFMECGRIPGGSHEHDLGVCPAYTGGAGQACWLVAGTLCGGEVPRTADGKIKRCSQCAFFQSFDVSHRAQMWEYFSPHCRR